MTIIRAILTMHNIKRMKSENFASRILATSKLRGSMETAHTNDVIYIPRGQAEVRD